MTCTRYQPWDHYESSMVRIKECIWWRDLPYFTGCMHTEGPSPDCDKGCPHPWIKEVKDGNQ